MFSYRVDDDISLAIPRRQDAKKIFEVVEKDVDYLSKWLPWPRSLKTVADEEDSLKLLLLHFGQGESLNLVIWYQHEIAGSISFNKFDQKNQSAEIGYWLAGDLQGHGIMHRCVEAMFTIGFTEYDCEKIMIRAATENGPSNHVIQKAGFHFDGVERHAQKLEQGWIDFNCYSLLKSEWLAR